MLTHSAPLSNCPAGQPHVSWKQLQRSKKKKTLLWNRADSLVIVAGRNNNVANAPFETTTLGPALGAEGRPDPISKGSMTGGLVQFVAGRPVNGWTPGVPCDMLRVERDFASSFLASINSKLEVRSGFAFDVGVGLFCSTSHSFPRLCCMLLLC